MFHFLHTFSPQPILLSFGPLTIYWYGLFMVLGILAALIVTFLLAKRYKVNHNLVFDLAFWLIIAGVAGARLYDVLLQAPYYLNHPQQIIQIWKGGLAIHGAIFAGLMVTWFFAKKHRLSFWKLTALITPGLALGQAFGRWGNYFNQELFGRPTALPWGIPIDVINRPLEHLSTIFFHPTFIYESLGNFLIFIILIGLNWLYFQRLKKAGPKFTTTNTVANQGTPAIPNFYVWITVLYMILYSILRFALEFIRLDETPLFFGWRWPQIISLALIIFFILILIFYKDGYRPAKIENKPTK